MGDQGEPSYLLHWRQSQRFLGRVQLDHVCLSGPSPKGQLYRPTDAVRAFSSLPLTMLRKSEVSPRPLTLSPSVRLSASSPGCSEEGQVHALPQT